MVQKDNRAPSVETCFCTAVLRCFQEVGLWLGLSQNVVSKRDISRESGGILQSYHGFFQLPYLFLNSVVKVLWLRGFLGR